MPVVHACLTVTGNLQSALELVPSTWLKENFWSYCFEDSSASQSGTMAVVAYCTG